jgi:hypothetical protein
MEIKREKVEVDVERKLALGMITSRRFLREVAHIWDEQLLDVPYVRTLGRWCLEYWQAYHKAPKQRIQDVYNAALRRGKVADSERDLLEDFLASLSEEWQRQGFNIDFWLDEAERYLDAQRLRILAEDAQAHISQGDVDAARQAFESYKPVKRPGGGAVNPLDGGVIESAFEEQAESLFTLPGAAGQLLNPLLTRAALVGVMAPEKRGKTFALTELAIRAAKSGLNVVFFAIGDMTHHQMVRRIGARLTGRVLKFVPEDKRYRPVYDCAHNQRGTCERTKGSGRLVDDDGENIAFKDRFKAFKAGITHTPCDHCRNTNSRAWRGAHWWRPTEPRRITTGKAKRSANRFIEVHGDRLRILEYGKRQINVKGIDAELTRLKEQQDFLADVVVVDYADNLGPEDSRTWEERHKQDQNWGALSTLRKDWNNCVITASQSDAESYKGEDISMSNFTEDKRKLGHVTAMLAINQKSHEKLERVVRLGVVVAREDDFHMEQQVVVLQDLTTGRALLGSYRR